MRRESFLFFHDFQIIQIPLVNDAPRGIRRRAFRILRDDSPSRTEYPDQSFGLERRSGLRQQGGKTGFGDGRRIGAEHRDRKRQLRTGHPPVRKRIDQFGGEPTHGHAVREERHGYLGTRCRRIAERH